jgi:hypothetical protein
MAENSNKGNPASKRMTNPRRKERRARSWLRGQKRKAERVKAQEERAAANRERRAEGLMTPWEIAKELRLDRRARAREEAA